uniref:MUS1 n=1 Tax=Arundo donax TaxID=35708 RepID=A0A0A9GFT2_ARUDO
MILRRVSGHCQQKPCVYIVAVLLLLNINRLQLLCFALSLCVTARVHAAQLPCIPRVIQLSSKREHCAQLL